MSINLGIYDFFAFIIPGSLYLYAFNELSKSIGWKYFDANSWFIPGQTPNIFFVIPILIGAYLVGHLMDPVSNKFFNLFSKLSNRSERGDLYMKSIKDRYPSLNIQFVPRDRTLFFALIRQRNIEMARILDSFSANSIMLRNVAFGLLLLSIAHVIFFFTDKTLDSIFVALFIFILSSLSKSRSNHYRRWFIKDVFRASLEYGTSVDEVVEYARNKKITVQAEKISKEPQKMHSSGTSKSGENALIDDTNYES